MRSSEALAGRQSFTRYPRAAPIIASAIPVLPDVASRIVLSRVSSPVRSASMTMVSAGRSFTEPPGLYHSALA